MAPADDDGPQFDPTFLNTRREAAIIFLVWVIALLWVVPVSYTLGYDDGPLTTVWGIPSWVFWGVAVPWAAAALFAVWFSLRVMADDDLGESAPETEA